jgi:hypothetical protein
MVLGRSPAAPRECDANRLAPNEILTSPTWRNFDVLEWLAFP